MARYDGMAVDDRTSEADTLFERRRTTNCLTTPPIVHYVWLNLEPSLRVLVSRSHGRLIVLVPSVG